MKRKLQNLIKLLLNLHKELLDFEREHYEKKNGPISSNNEYFVLVVNHEDFQWLRKLSELIALLDEESEQMEIDINKIKEILADLKTMLSADDQSEFSLKYKLAKADNDIIVQFDDQIKNEI
jgi:hypothetical protein